MIGSIGFFDCFVMIEKLKTFTFEKATPADAAFVCARQTQNAPP